MSDLRVEVVHIDEILIHPNADRLEVARVWGWAVVVPKGVYKQGDKAIYIPIDSLLPEKLEAHLFPPDSKIKLEKHRVRSIRIRQAISQGMVISADAALEQLYPGIAKKRVGDDVAEMLGITKYEPPLHSIPRHMRGKTAKKRHPLFMEYTNIQNWKYHPELFQPDDIIYASEKIHGSAARYGILPTHVDTLWKRIKKFLHILPQYEFVFGSHHVQLQGKQGHKTYYEKNVYAIMARQLEIEHRLRPGEVLYGEIAGSGIQKGYEYGCGPNEWLFFVYDVMVDGEYLNAPELIQWCQDRGFTIVPTLYIGPLSGVDLNALRSGPSLVGGQPVREGLVVRSIPEKISYMGRQILKYINDDYYLLKDQTDFH